MIDEARTHEIVGSTAYDQDGDKIGKVGQLFLDDQTGRPEFITVNTGFFGTKESFVPVASATLDGDRLTVPYDKDTIKAAPSVDLDGGHLDESEEQRLFQHYGMTYGGTGDLGTGDLGTDTTTGYVAPAGHDTSGADTDDAMTRSEEHLHTSTETHEAGRARLRKYVTTERETQTVPVAKERAVVEREPVTDATIGDALDGPTISEEEHEVVLHEEQAVAGTTAEPVERVRLATETTIEDEAVSADVRKEHIEVEGDADRRP
jgi:uncharacterized protein (TIGR02271 family)